MPAPPTLPGCACLNSSCCFSAAIPGPRVAHAEDDAVGLLLCIHDDDAPQRVLDRVANEVAERVEEEVGIESHSQAAVDVCLEPEPLPRCLYFVIADYAIDELGWMDLLGADGDLPGLKPLEAQDSVDEDPDTPDVPPQLVDDLDVGALFVSPEQFDLQR
jgi:hypothetical protein